MEVSALRGPRSGRVAEHSGLLQVDDTYQQCSISPDEWMAYQRLAMADLYRNLFHVTGTDIVRALAYRFQAFGRPVRNVKKFEEGIFSDLRNLKP